MGLHRYFTLSLLHVDKAPRRTLLRIVKDIEKMLTYQPFTEDDGDAFRTDTDMSWYDVDKDMTALSVHYPGVVIALYCEGGHDEDYWIAYYKDGKMQTCFREVRYPEFDETKLEELKKV